MSTYNAEAINEVLRITDRESARPVWLMIKQDTQMSSVSGKRAGQCLSRYVRAYGYPEFKITLIK